MPGRGALCSESYRMQSSSAAWPATDLLKEFKQSILNESYQERRKAGYRGISAWNNVLNANDSMLGAMVRDNVAKVDISPRAAHSNRIEEDRVYPAINLFSDIGGILGLYLGMSMLSLIELFQALVLVSEALLASWKKKREVGDDIGMAQRKT